MSMQFYEALTPETGRPISLQLVDAADGSVRGNRFTPAPAHDEDIIKLADEVRAFGQRLIDYQLSYLRLSVDGDEVAIFSPRDTACEPFKVPTTASFIEVNGEDYDGEQLLLAAFPLTHLDPSRRREIHHMSSLCGRGHLITLVLSPLADEDDGPLSYWVVRPECRPLGPPVEGAPSRDEPTILGRYGLGRLEAFPTPPMPFPEPNTNPFVRIVIVGIGSSGCNTVDKMIGAGMQGVTFAAMNTDLQALQLSRAPIKVQLGQKITRGLGAGSNAEVGRTAAIESTEKIVEVLAGADMVLVTTGMGGGTGTGAAPVVANLARELGALTAAVVTTPFAFEGRLKAQRAGMGLNLLCERADTVFTLPNERLLRTLYKGISLRQALATTDDVVRRAVQSILDLVAAPGLINLDFAVVRAILAGSGSAFLGTGRARGEMRALEAMQQAISSPLLEEATIEGARSVLINITGGSSLTLYEVSEASSIIREIADEDANIIFGAVIDETLRDEMKITIIATGCGRP